jgi:hypothetical protein
MADRISKAQLERVVATINKTMGLPTEPYGKDANGKFKQIPDVYLLDFANGGVALDQNCSDKGGGSHGVGVVFERTNARGLYLQLKAFVYGMEVMKR